MPITKKFCDPTNRYEKGAIVSFRVRYVPHGALQEVIITENWRIISKSPHPENQTLANYVAAFESVA